MADLWLAGMAEGAATSGRTVQYCMPYPNQILSAAAYQAVTNARATGDYFHADNQGFNPLKASSSSQEDAGSWVQKLSGIVVTTSIPGHSGQIKVG